MLSLPSMAYMALLFSGSVTAHMKIITPVPFGKDTLDTSPLKADGSDFPCKQRSGVYDISTMNQMAVGESQVLSFDGSASHGGGSCILAVSLDKAPTKQSTWKTIFAYEGGCPTASTSGGSHPFNFTLPDIPNGRATFAWLWYNKIGNRELYMNCAPIQVTGGSDSTDKYDSLPNAYVINLDNGCTTVDSADVIIPGVPADMVLKDSTDLTAATGSRCAAIAAAVTAEIKSTPSASVSSGPHDTSTLAPSKASSTSAASSAVSHSTQASGSTPTPVATFTATSYPTMTVSSGAGIFGPGSTAASAAAPAGTGSSGSSTGACSSDGQIVCNGASQFGICNHGKVVYQAVAAGTQCKNGSITKRSDMRNGQMRRHAQHAGKHAA